MKKFFKIIGIIILTLLLGVIAFYLYWTDFGTKRILFQGPRKPKVEVPITYTIGWWANQKALTIDTLEIKVIESELNLFNSKSLISYNVAGQLICERHWQPKIKEIHISERINLDTLLHCDRIIEITPVIEVGENRKAKGSKSNFSFKNEHTIISNHWGINRIKFVCGNKEQIIELLQRK
ncbi:hypothetical protein [Flavobacterium humi]|uniref:Uncharacterized protein n=1 Tax=Flavobacterium humi TaxID=2562683 RepID=A0A4Z0LC67_9FLAO|nr:hypothetical protein [Flavobacterium humi]TGD59481.1 hypothetical protein E4635_00675 [Flavobacterium humi]